MDKEKLQGTVLVVIEQKGSDAEECRERFLAGCEVYRRLVERTDMPAHLLIVGGGNNGNSPETIRSWCPPELLDILIIDNKAANTYEKAVSILEYINKLNIDTVIQVTSLYHSLRAYLTTLRLVQEQAPNVIFKNYVCDSSDLPTIYYAVKDQLLMAAAIDENISFKIDDAVIQSYLDDAKQAKLDAGLSKYFVKRYAESSRLVAYCELGKDHLTTKVSFTQVVDSYITI